ncbi:uncharacterized protein Hyls1 [Cloeon dipterum]|uniref:uncharacterized protein Hyls1 n=1 Tax=Cloeon dipterum TaxID=197152 RepID=UPI00321FF65F
MNSRRSTYEHYKINDKHHFKIHLDPDDVLQKLKNRGYNNVSPDQLKEFMKDLKKLIKHDLRKKHSTSDSTHQSRSIESSSVSKDSTDTTPSKRSRGPLCQLDTGNSMIDYCGGSSSGSSRSELKEESTHKKTRVPKKTLPEPPRHDPVALYHYYNKFWKQFNIPNENKPLNWDVREQTKRSAGDRLCF